MRTGMRCRPKPPGRAAKWPGTGIAQPPHALQRVVEAGLRRVAATQPGGRVDRHLGGEHAQMENDASDALGIALCHAHTRTLAQQYAEVLP